MIAFWPDAVSAHLAQDSSGYTVAGTTYPTARIITITETSCEGAAGSTSGGSRQTCATIAAQLLDGPEKGQTVQVAANSSATYEFDIAVPVGAQPGFYEIDIGLFNGSACLLVKLIMLPKAK